MPLAQRLAAAAALSAALASAALAQQGDPRPGYDEILSADRLAALVANTAIAGLRTQMEVEYDYLSTDILRGTVALSGVTLRPPLDYDLARQCAIQIERAVFGSDVSQPFSVATEVTVTLLGARASVACVPSEVAIGLRTAGFNEIGFDRLTVAGTYAYGTGATRLDVSAAVNGIGVLDAAADVTFLPRPGPYGMTGDPALRVSRAVLSLRDTGGWAALSTLLPENLRQPETIRALGTEELSRALSEGGSRALTAVERNFVEDLMTHVEAFVRDPGEITLEADLPPDGIVLEPSTYQKPSELIAALAIDARTAPLARSRLVDPALLARLNGDLSNAERLELASALMTGRGVPMAEALVPDLLTPVLEAGGAQAAEAAVLTARALRITDPATAYASALTAAAGGADGALPMLDQIEAVLTTPDAVAAQDAALAGAAPAEAALAGLDDDPRSLRSLALSHFTGLGAPRSYRRAYYYALLAEAAGDIGAITLRGEIEARFASRGDAVRVFWQDLRTEVQEAALNDWIAADLAGRYGVE